jgi:hypothetical protein
MWLPIGRFMVLGCRVACVKERVVPISYEVRFNDPFPPEKVVAKLRVPMGETLGQICTFFPILAMWKAKYRLFTVGRAMGKIGLKVNLLLSLIHQPFFAIKPI